ncbi:dTDP-4-dehydrorhamnose reductase [Achromobacter sp. Root565]|uniref:dTDP-4-dehydrorhamnose reductase n=1 Tax=Achromobacter sp. Root565 TaxID=1736564 RepID=UPI0006F6E894|nr:dTDP-4-dehydrorhamnose reductase [Achromobacter sp. Root565]KQZ96434.1 dTDP-4-dehydrorhamnose reductase [Achromobacter sp. Root565]
MPNILLLGKDGQVGRALRAVLPAVGDVTALGRDALDLRDHAAIAATLDAHRPGIIVNAAAWTAVDQAEREPDAAAAVNALAVAALAQHAAVSGALLVHYSTDYVFDGALARPYTEADAPHPINVYGATKLAGERAIAASGCEAFVLRCSWIHSLHGRNFFRTILNLARTRESLNVVADQQGTPTPASLIAQTTAMCLARHRQRALPAGLYHVAAAGSTTWHGYAQYLVAGALERGINLKLGPAQIAAVSSADYAASAPRPRNSCLDTRALTVAAGFAPAAWTTYVDQSLDELISSGSAEDFFSQA